MEVELRVHLQGRIDPLILRGQVLVVTGGGDGLVRMWDEKHFGNGSPVVHQVCTQMPEARDPGPET